MTEIELVGGTTTMMEISQLVSLPILLTMPLTICAYGNRKDNTILFSVLSAAERFFCWLQEDKIRQASMITKMC